MSRITSLANLSLQKKVSLFVIIGLLTGLGLFSWLGLQSLEESTDRILDERLGIARLMASHLDKTLAYIQLEMQDVNIGDGFPTDEQFSSAADSLRNTLSNSGVSTQNILLASEQGQILRAEPNDPGIIGMDMSQYPEVSRALETGLPTISSLVSSPLLEAPVVFATVPIFDENGTIIGVLMSSIDVERSSNQAFKPAITIGETGYTEIVDSNGIVLARTKPGSPPEVFEMSDHPARFTELISQQKATVGTCHRCHETADTLERRQDVLAFSPLLTTSWGVAIRQAEEEALAPTRQLEQKLFFVGIILLCGTFILMWGMMQDIVKPIRMLTSAAKRVAAGDFKAAIPVKRQDEIGQLSDAFYTMTQELVKSRDELMLRNEELSALNSIAVTVSQSLNLDDVLESSLLKVLEVTRTSAGCVFLRGSDGIKLEMMSRIGSSGIFKCQESGLSSDNCACHQVLGNGQTLIVNDVSQCPMLTEDTLMTVDYSSFASVPLKSKEDRILGIMNIVCSNERCFTENDFRILDSIGYHVGLTIENSVLYEETKQKEELRGQLLSSVINAQEEERKRIARELHDEFGQTLTGLIMSIESLENMTPSKQSQFKDKLKNARSIIAHALQDTRKLTLDLRPSTLDDLGLVATTRAYAQSHLEAAGIHVDFESKGVDGRLTSAVETALFRIIQEAIHNIDKHAEASNVKIKLEVIAGKITAVIEDDGKGFHVDTIFKSKIGVQSLGLLGIQERASLLGGTFDIQSRVGYGTRLMVTIPVPSSLESPV